MDLIFPHHENEIAQSCGAHGEQNNPQVFVKYWIHNAMLNIGGKKMSKSLGNIFYIRDYTEKYPGEVLRYALLSGHYRQSLNWTDKSIDQAHSTLNRIYRVLKRVESFEIDIKNTSLPESILNSLCDDLNTPEAMAHLNDMVSKLSKSTNDSDITKLKQQVISSGKILGILQESPDSWLGIGQSQSDDTSMINKLIEQRNEARKLKNFSEADQIRNKLSGMGIEIEDTPDGTIWRKK